MSTLFRGRREVGQPPPAKRRRTASPTRKAASIRDTRRLPVRPKQLTISPRRGQPKLAFVAPVLPVAVEEKRVLRSKDGISRSHSDLAQFFPEYDDHVFGDDREPDLVTQNTVFVVTDYRKKPSTDSATKPTVVKRRFPVGPANLFPRKDFAQYQKEVRKYVEDPLQDEVYLSAHRRGERKEKQLRNIEKERAMHEKAELERLLDELQGPDWLKTMGVSGVTDSEKKTFEPKRWHYVRAVRALLDKFSLWREQEKELKMRLDQEAQHRLEQTKTTVRASQRTGHKKSARKHVEESTILENKKPLVNGVDAGLLKSNDQPDADQPRTSPPKSRQKPAKKSSKEILNPPDVSVPLVESNLSSKDTLTESQEDRRDLEVKETPKEKQEAPLHTKDPFTTFFTKPHERAAAIGKQRRVRVVTAFGMPVPEPEEHEFLLPNDLANDEALFTSNARRRRRQKRGRD